MEKENGKVKEAVGRHPEGGMRAVGVSGSGILRGGGGVMDGGIERKYIGADIIGMLGDIVQRHTSHYRSDFELDKRIFTAALSRKDREGRSFLWLCRELGTWCLRERDVYVRGTREHDTYCYYAGCREGAVLAYAVEVRGSAAGIPVGDVYALDYAGHCRFVQENAVAPGGVRRVYEHGERVMGPEGQARAEGMGRLLEVEHLPAAPQMLAGLLRSERLRRGRFRDG